MTGFTSAFLAILPALLAGVVHAVVLRFNFGAWMTQPVDFGIQVRGRPLFGKNKTFRGFVVLAVFTALAAWLLSFVLGPDQLPPGLPFMAEPGSAVGYGLLLGFGYMLSELPNSFVKRQLDIPPGDRPSGPSRVLFYLTDQLDSVIGVVLLLWIVYAPPAGVLLSILLVGGIVHILYDWMMYVLGIKRHPKRAAVGAEGVRA